MSMQEGYGWLVVPVKPFGRPICYPSSLISPSQDMNDEEKREGE